MEGTVIKISRFCTDDGPGIRTVVFLKGCPLSCIWCHNPESQKKDSEILYSTEKCLHCGKCVLLCPNACHSLTNGMHEFSLKNCTTCKKCANSCPASAVEVIGEKVSAEQILDVVKKDCVFYDTSNGGVTVSGGEPLFQPEFTSEILRLCKENGIHTAIETCGFASKTALLTVLKYCDYVLFDIKETDEENHLKFTGVSQKPILENLKTINDMKIPFLIRLPIIPGLNDRKEHFLKVKELAKNLESCKGIEIMPYHVLGAYKYDLLQKNYACKSIQEPDKETVTEWRKLVEY